MRLPTTRPLHVVLGAIVAAGVLTACGAGGGGDGGDGSSGDDVASLGDTPKDSAATDDTTETTEAMDPDEAVLAFTECMREHGIDLPDPQATGGGDVVMGAAADDIDFTSDEFKAAQAECEPLLQQARGEMTIDPEEEAEMREAMLAFTECMREHGIDLPDPEFTTDGGGGVQIQGRVATDDGSDDGNGGPPPAMEDPDAFNAAAEECGGPNGPGLRVVEEGS
jgi:hypothetical protein